MQFNLSIILQGGECDLQDQSMAFGSDRSRFTGIVKDNTIHNNEI